MSPDAGADQIIPCAKVFPAPEYSLCQSIPRQNIPCAKLFPTPEEFPAAEDSHGLWPDRNPHKH